MQSRGDGRGHGAQRRGAGHLSQLPTFPANFAAFAISSGGVVQATNASGSASATHSDVTGLGLDRDTHLRNRPATP